MSNAQEEKVVVDKPTTLASAIATAVAVGVGFFGLLAAFAGTPLAETPHAGTPLAETPLAETPQVRQTYAQLQAPIKDVSKELADQASKRVNGAKRSVSM